MLCLAKYNYEGLRRIWNKKENNKEVKERKRRERKGARREGSEGRRKQDITIKGVFDDRLGRKVPDIRASTTEEQLTGVCLESEVNIPNCFK